MPTWLTSLTGGLGCLQALSYIAVVVLLLLPVSNAYFRRRPQPPRPTYRPIPSRARPRPTPDDGAPPTGR